MALRFNDSSTRTTTRHIGARSAVLAGAAFAGFVSLGACTPMGVQPVIDQVFGPVAPQATAIARCESGLNPNAVSPTNDHGLFQINAVHMGAFTQVTGQSWASIYDPYWNAVYAKRMFDTQGWGPWSCKYVLGM